MMRTERWVVGVVVVGCMLAAGMASAAGDAARGKSLYAGKCAACHGAGGKGDGAVAAALNPPPSNFTDPAFWKGATDATIATTIEKGHGDMPPMDQNPQDVRDLTAYLTQTFKK